ncbi:MAG TPA: arginase family protein [Bacteroidales bacterium]|nr:arginase family protein [Bacteroidales bacterium]
MLDLNDYFNPVSIDKPEFEYIDRQGSFPHNISINTESNPVNEIDKFRVAVFGVPDGRNSPNPGSFKAPDSIRSQIYRLARIPGKMKIVDLGNMKQGVTFNDTLAGLADILAYLFSKKVFPVLLGGSSSLIQAIDIAFSRSKTKYNLAAIDPRICYSHEKKQPAIFNYLNTIAGKSSGFMAHYTNIGYQTYLNDPQVINRFVRKRSDIVRIGDVRQSIHLMEPLLRDSDAIVLNISSVRQSDAPGTFSPSPNGFYGEEICLLSRYSGISDRVRVFGIFDINPEFDVRELTSGLAAQIIWFFLEGFSQKQFETPVLGSSVPGRFIKYHVRVTGLEEDIIFIKSCLTERWWLEIHTEKSGDFHVACSHEDYLQANRNEVPDRWIKSVEKLR